MKNVGISHIEAIRRLFEKGKREFLRTVHIVFGPEEEINGGKDGMDIYTKTDDFNR